MIKKTGKMNKARGNIVLTIGKEEVKKHDLDSGEYIILTEEEYDDLLTSSQIEVSTIEVVPDEEAVVKLQYDLKESKSREKILFERVEELEKINLDISTKLSKIEEENYAKTNNLDDSNYSSSMLSQIKELNEKVDKLNEDLHESESERIELLEDMNVLKTKMSFDATELATLREREEKHKNVLEMLLKTNKSIIEETVNKTVTSTILEINSELAQTGLIRRIRGLTIVKEPDIKKEQIAINSYKQLEQIVPENYFLEDGSDK
jgi:chromosome segregation ATPase